MENHWRKPPLSDHYDGRRFHNLLPTPTMADNTSIFSVIRDRFNRPPGMRPAAALPCVVTDLKSISSDRPVLVWFGHSSYLIHYLGMNLLVDPVFSGHASPLSFMIRAFPGSDHYRPADMPPIDLLIISHDHYDHLDKDTVAALKPRIRAVVTSIGVGDTVHRFDIAEDIITEMDWGESLTPLPGVTLTATPARHFSGRGLLRDRSLWSSFVLQLGAYRIYLGGDSGYGPHFREIGLQHGPFDLALLECGQYSVNWPYIHMLPEQTAQAALELKTKWLMPVHWGKFTLGDHPWNEPPERLLKAAGVMGLNVTTPQIGEPVVVGESYPKARWWE